METGKGDGLHRCPGKCGNVIRDYLYACGGCWKRLPSDIKQLILQTAPLGTESPDRQRALTRAADFYGGVQ